MDIKFGGQIASDIRFRLGGEEVPPPSPTATVPYPSQQRLLKYGFSRNENLIKAQLTLSICDRVKAVADVDFYWYGYSDVNDIDAATLHERVDPYRLEANAAYVDIYKILPHLDLRIGRQVVVWGTGDKFNPTNNLNTLDLSDPLLFGKAIANNMIRADWNPWGDLIVTAVWVPIFRPAQLPRTAPLAVTTPNRPAPVQEEFIRSSLGAFAQAMPPTQINVSRCSPIRRSRTRRSACASAGRFGGLDMSVSYYHGRWGIPTPAWAVQKPNGIVDAIVMWPRMDVLGADIAGSIEKLKGLGYWIEAGLYLPAEDHLRHLQRRASAGTIRSRSSRPAPRTPDGNDQFITHITSPEFQRGTVDAVDAVRQADRRRRLHLEQVPLLEPAVRLRLHRRVRRRRSSCFAREHDHVRRLPLRGAPRPLPRASAAT